MANIFSDEQLKGIDEAIASPVKRAVAPDGRAYEAHEADDLIKRKNHMVNTNRAAAGTRRRQTRLMGSKGF
jgi:hypothetical protein